MKNNVIMLMPSIINSTSVLALHNVEKTVISLSITVPEKEAGIGVKTK